MTVGSTIQNFSVCTPAPISWVVHVIVVLSDVLRSHCRFMPPSSDPVTWVMFTICGAPSSIETAYLRPSVGSTLLRGCSIVDRVTGPGDVVVNVYSRRGLSPPGVWLAAFDGHGVMPLPVLAMSGSTCQPIPFAPTA